MCACDRDGPRIIHYPRVNRALTRGTPPTARGLLNVVGSRVDGREDDVAVHKLAPLVLISVMLNGVDVFALQAPITISPPYPSAALSPPQGVGRTPSPVICPSDETARTNVCVSSLLCRSEYDAGP